VTLVGVFYTSKYRVNKITHFQFRDGLVNKEQKDLSEFRPLLRGNSLTSSGLIFDENRWFFFNEGPGPLRCFTNQGQNVITKWTQLF
jgi:hypothetical protein